MHPRVAFIFSALLASSASGQPLFEGFVTQVTTNVAPQFDPSISGDIVVYTDRRGGNDDIYFTDLSTGSETAATNSAWDQRLHDVSGGKIVFTDFSTATSQVWAYDIALGTSGPIESSALRQLEPTIDGSRVVFEVYDPATNRADVALVDLATGSYSLLTQTSEHEGRPTVGGSLVVFERGPAPLSPLSEVVLYNIATGVETTLGGGLEPHTDGRRVAWRTGPNLEADLVIFDTFDNSTITISYPGAQTRARLSGDVLAYDDDSLGDPDVVLRHLPSGVEHRVVGTSGASQFLADLDGTRLVYTSAQTGNFDIFRYDFSIVETACDLIRIPSPFLVGAWMMDEGSEIEVRELHDRYPLYPATGSVPPVVHGSLVGGFSSSRGARGFTGDGTLTRMMTPLWLGGEPLYQALASSNYTVSFWMKPYGYGYPLYVGGPVGDGGGTSQNLMLEIFVQSNGRIRILWERENAANVALYSDIPITFQSTYQVMVTVEATSQTTALVTLEVRDSNGALHEQKVWQSVARAVPSDLDQTVWMVAGRNGSSGAFAAALDSMSVYAQPLTPERRQALFNAERQGVVASWPLEEQYDLASARDAMGRYDLPRLTVDPVFVVEGLEASAIPGVGAREILATPFVRPGTEQLSDIFADSEYTVTFLFLPDTVASGQRVILDYGGIPADGYNGRDNYQFDVLQAGDELRMFWEYGSGSNVVMTTPDLNLVAGRAYSAAVVVSDSADPAYRDVMLDVLDLTTLMSRQFNFTRIRTKRGEVDRMNLSVGGLSRISDGEIFKGVLDEVHVFGRALTTTEISDLRDAQQGLEMVCSPGFLEAP